MINRIAARPFPGTPNVRRPTSAPSPFSTVLAFASSFYRPWHRKQDLARLNSFDDALLKDIGLTRSDVDWATHQPWHRDPMSALFDRVSCRRGARRWADDRRSGAR